MLATWFDGWSGPAWLGSWADSFRLGMAMASGTAQELASWISLTLYAVAGWLLLVGVIAALLVGRAASGKGAAAFGIVPLAVNVQIAGDCHGGNLLFCGSPSVPGGTDGKREPGGYRTFFCRNFVWLTSSRSPLA